jgi:hypothetical protein
MNSRTVTGRAIRQGTFGENPMFNFSTGGQVGIESTDTGPYIIVSRHQLATVCELLAAHWVPHTLAGFVPDPFSDDDPIEAVICISSCREDGRVQQILDGAP